MPRNHRVVVPAGRGFCTVDRRDGAGRRAHRRGSLGYGPRGSSLVAQVDDVPCQVELRLSAGQHGDRPQVSPTQFVSSARVRREREHLVEGRGVDVVPHARALACSVRYRWLSSERATAVREGRRAITRGLAHCRTTRGDHTDLPAFLRPIARSALENLDVAMVARCIKKPLSIGNREKLSAITQLPIVLIAILPIFGNPPKKCTSRKNYTSTKDARPLFVRS